MATLENQKKALGRSATALMMLAMSVTTSALVSAPTANAAAAGGTCPRAGVLSTSTPQLVCRSTRVRGRTVLRWAINRTATTRAPSSALASCIRGRWVEGAESINNFVRELVGVPLPIILTGEMNFDFDGTQIRGSGSITGMNTTASGLPEGFTTVQAQAISIIPYTVGSGTITVRSQFADRAPAFFDLQLQMNGTPLEIASPGVSEPSVTSAATCSGNTLRFVITTPMGRSASRTLTRFV